MDLQHVIKTLKQHNKWRRDNNVPAKTKQVDPIILGKAIDVAVGELNKLLDDKFFYCQREIEQEGICSSQCEHCESYYKPLEVNN